MLATSPIHHLVITVADLAKTRRFYTEVLSLLGWTIRGESESFVEYVPPGDPKGESFLLVFGLPRDKPAALPFDRNQVGLDHFSFAAQSETQLQRFADELIRRGYAIEDGGITGDDFGARAVFLTDPDGMKVEVHLCEARAS